MFAAQVRDGAWNDIHCYGELASAHCHQSESGLNYNWNRDYDPMAGGYIESDPIGLAGGSESTYSYAVANPVSSLDPSGLVSPADEANAMGLLLPIPEPTYTISPEVKAAICKEIASCNGDLEWVFKYFNTARHADHNRNWLDPTLRDAENWSFSAAFTPVQSLGLTSDFAIYMWQEHKLLKGLLPLHTSDYSESAYEAGMEARAHRGQSPEELAKWCSGCSK